MVLSSYLIDVPLTLEDRYFSVWLSCAGRMLYARMTVSSLGMSVTFAHTASSSSIRPHWSGSNGSRPCTNCWRLTCGWRKSESTEGLLEVNAFVTGEVDRAVRTVHVPRPLQLVGDSLDSCLFCSTVVLGYPQEFIAKSARIPQSFSALPQDVIGSQHLLGSTTGRETRGSVFGIVKHERR